MLLPGSKRMVCIIRTTITITAAVITTAVTAITVTITEVIDVIADTVTTRKKITWSHFSSATAVCL